MVVVHRVAGSCAHCGDPLNHEQAETCGYACAWQLRLVRAGGCEACAGYRGPCDDHEVPPVCVCAVPAPNAGGECAHCHRPFKPQVPGFTECRAAWIDQLALNLKETSA